MAPQPCPPRSGQGFSPDRLRIRISTSKQVKRVKEPILAVQRMQDYIEAHLAEEITLAGLSRAALFSPWYARRIFREHVLVHPSQ